MTNRSGSVIETAVIHRWKTTLVRKSNIQSRHVGYCQDVESWLDTVMSMCHSQAKRFQRFKQRRPEGPSKRWTPCNLCWPHHDLPPAQIITRAGIARFLQVESLDPPQMSCGTLILLLAYEGEAEAIKRSLGGQEMGVIGQSSAL